MNKNRHRIIFNAARGQRMVVAENASSVGVGNTSGATRAPASSVQSLGDLDICKPNPLRHLALHPVTLSVALALTLGFVFVITAHAQIVADPSAPGSQRPTVLQTANGVPQINIQTPSAAGVSRNTYSQFDVQSNGAILNNSRTNTSTQLGGFVAANPWLATGEARVILNEVNSSNPSHLNGFVEVAGRRAEVIIANPAGIQVNGGGFINASGVTLTTGTPVMNSGHLDAFRVQGGSVKIEGLGLDTSTADYTTILARAMQVNAGLWAKDLTVVTGTNEVKALASGAAAETTKIASSGPEPKPTFMLDTGALGGMYAGKIFLVGTEAGVGVNNRGALIAQEGTWVLQTDGSLVNTGKIQAKGDLSIQTTGAISNSGDGSSTGAGSAASALISSQGNASLVAGTTLSNTDKAEIAASGALTVNAVGALDNTAGTLGADGAVQITAAGMDNTRGTVLSLQSTLGVNTVVDMGAGAVAGTLTNHLGTMAASQGATITSGALNNDQGLIQAGGALVIDTQGQTLVNTNAAGYASGAGAGGGGVSGGVSGGIAAGGPVTLTTGELNNAAGSIGSGGALRVTAGQTNNAGGEMLSAGTLDVTTQGSLNNVRGRLQSVGSSTIDTQGAQLDNTAGRIASQAALNLKTGELLNAAQTDQGGLIGSNGKLTIQAGATTNGAGGVGGSGSAIVKSNMWSAQATSITATSFTNAGMVSGAGVALNATDDLVNAAGSSIESSVDLSITTTADLNNAGELIANQRLTLSARDIGNTGSLEAARQQLTATGTFTNAAGARIVSSDSITIAATTLNNQGLVNANEAIGTAPGSVVHLAATTVNNTGAGAIFGDRIAIAATTLNNRPAAGGGAGSTAPVIAARQQLDIGAQTLNNEDGALIYSGGGMAVAGSLDAALSATGQAQSINNLSAQIEAVGDLRIATSTLTNQRRNVSVSPVHVSSQTAELSMPSWWVNGHNRFFDTPIETTSNYTPNQFYLVNPANILSDTQLVTPDGTVVRRVELTLDPTDSVYHAAAGGYAGNYGVRERITVGSAATVVLYARVRQDGVANPDQVAGASDPTASYTASVFDWQRDSLSYSNAYGRCTTNCTMLVVEPGYTDPMSTIVRATHRNLTPTHPGLEITRTARQTVVEDRLNADAGAAASIRSGANMRLNIATALTNRYADIQAGAVLDLQAGGATVVNEGQTLKRTHSFLNTSHTAGQGSFDWTNPDISEVIGQVGGALSGAQQLSITAKSLTNTDLARTTALPTSGLGFLGVSLPAASAPITVPNNALFQPASPGSSYLIESDPRFTNYRQWLGSDYMFTALGSDPNALQKRLGDGFYEQKLIREQVAQLTGRRFLSGYANDEAQFQALMDSGVAYAQQWSLVPGVALTAQQMAQLTTDLVWLVEREVVLPDGSTTKALVPQLYVRKVAEGDFAASGALLAGNTVNLQIAEDLVNAGGRIEGGVVVAQAGRDLSNIGGLMQARTELLASARRNVTISSPTYTTSFNGAYVNQSRTELAGVGTMRVGNTNGAKLSIEAGGNVALLGASVSNAGAGGSTVIKAGGDVQLQTVTVGNSDNTEYNARNYQRSSSSRELGTSVQGAGSISIQAANDVVARAASVNAGDDLSVKAGNNITVEAGRSVSESESSLYVQRRGFLSKKSTEELRSSASDVALGSSLGGKNVSMQAGQDIALRGSSVVADNNTTLSAGRDVVIEAEENQFSSSEFRETKKSGLFASGAGITLGKQQRSRGQQFEQTTAAGSTVGAIGGDVTVIAGQNYRQSGSDLLAPGGDVTVVAKDIAITEARETSQSTTEEKFKQSGLSVSLGGALVTAAQGMANTAKAMGETKNERMQALGAATLALQGQEVAKGVQALASNPTAETGVSVSISLGSSKSQSTQSSQSDTARGSTVTAGRDVNLMATGAGKDSGLLVQGSDIAAAKTARLSADGDVTLQAAANQAQESSNQSSSSGSIGIGFSAGAGGGGFGVTVSASKGKGQGAGEETIQRNTQVNAGNLIMLDSGGDTTLKGAVAQAEQIQARVGGDLNVQSLQDTATYIEASKNSGFSATVGAGAGGSISAGKTKIESDYASVNQQSGLRAGDGGFQVSVAGDTALQGGAITSTDKAVQAGANRFEADGKLTLSDISNQAQYKADASGLTIGVGGQLGSSGAGVGSDDGAASSTTLAAVSGVAGNTAARTGDAQPGIGQIFDKDRVKDEVGAQVAIMKAFTQQAVPAGARYADGKAVDLRRVGNEEEARKWDEGGEYRVAMHSGIGLLTGGLAGAAGAAAGASLVPVLGEQIALMNLPEPVRQGLTQVVGAAVGAVAGGTAGAATSLNQTAHNYVSHSPFAGVRRTVSQENARLTNACGSNCTAQDFQRIDQQMAALERAGNLTAMAQRGGLTTAQGSQLAQLVMELAPFYGSGESMAQLITGKSTLTGEEASRFWAAVGVVPVAGGVFKRVGEPSAEAIKVALKELNQALDAVALQKLQVLQQQRMGEITQLFNRQDAANSVTFAGKSYPAATNPAGTTKTFDTSGLAPGELQTRVFEFAKELTGGAPLKPVDAGVWAAKLPDGTTVNVRSVSSSNVGRWTVDVKGPVTTQNNLPKYELKFQ